MGLVIWDPPGSGGGRAPPLEVVVEEDLPPPPAKDQKYCWASGWYALEKRLSCYLDVSSFSGSPLFFIYSVITGFFFLSEQRVFFLFIHSTIHKKILFAL